MSGTQHRAGCCEPSSCGTAWSKCRYKFYWPRQELDPLKPRLSQHSTSCHQHSSASTLLTSIQPSTSCQAAGSPPPACTGAGDRGGILCFFIAQTPVLFCAGSPPCCVSAEAVQHCIPPAPTKCSSDPHGPARQGAGGTGGFRFNGRATLK
jgi:hypothetical protein